MYAVLTLILKLGSFTETNLFQTGWLRGIRAVPLWYSSAVPRCRCPPKTGLIFFGMDFITLNKVTGQSRAVCTTIAVCVIHVPLPLTTGNFKIFSR